MAFRVCFHKTVRRFLASIVHYHNDDGDDGEDDNDDDDQNFVAKKIP